MANLTTLFASPADCECKDCKNIFSPESYLVDIMQYLDNCPSNGTGGLSVLQVLFERRPDIRDLLLTCENTNTEIPYIDLVNEVMEYYVAHSADNTISFMPGNTGKATAEELKAEPQYILLDAYKLVYQKLYPFNLPYHQPLDVIRTYLNFLKTSRVEIMEVFPKYYDGSTPPNLVAIPTAAIDAERMQLSLNEYLILTNYASDFSGAAIPAASIPALNDYYGGVNFAGNGIPLSGKSIAANPGLLTITGLQYTDLLAILETKFINAGQDAYNVLQALLSNTTGIAATDMYAALKTDYQNLSTSSTSGLSALTTTLLAKNNITDPADQASFKKWLLANFTRFQQVITVYQADNTCNLDNALLHSIQWLYENGTTPGFTAAAPIKNPDGSIHGFSDLGQDPTINAAATGFLSRLHRFIRLWRKTGWAVHELDLMIYSLGETDITVTLIQKLAAVSKINAILNLPVPQLASLWGDMDTYGDDSANFPQNSSLYAQLFLRPTGNVISNGVAVKSIFAPDLLNQLFVNTATPPAMSDHLPEILAALSISSDDYMAIIKDAAPPDNNVSVKNLSILYRYKLLANALALAVTDLCTLKSKPCFNLDPFGKPGDAYDFIHDVQKFQGAQTAQSSLTVPLLRYMLSVDAIPVANISPSQADILKLFPLERAACIKIDNDNPSSDLDIISPTLLTTKLILLYSTDVAAQLVFMFQSTAASISPAVICGAPVPDNSIAIPAALAGKYFYYKDPATQKWTLQASGVMSDTEYGAFGAPFKAVQSTIDFIYNYPYRFFKTVLGAPYSNEQDIDLALFYLFGLSKINPAFVPPAGAVPLTNLTARLQYFYTAFLPYLKTQLKQAQATSMIAQLVNLDIQNATAVFGPDLQHVISAVVDSGLDATYYKKTGATSMLALSRTDATINFSWGDGAPDTNVSADNFSVQWTGWICPPLDGNYTFTLNITETDESATLAIGGVQLISIAPADNLISKQASITLTGGTLYPITVTYIEQSDNAGVQLFWQSANIPQAIVDTQYLYPDSDVQALLSKLLQYHRAAGVITGFGLHAEETSYFINNPLDFGSLNFLPLTIAQWLRLNDYTQLKKAIPENLLLPIFQQAAAEDKLKPGVLPSDSLVTAIANASLPKWNKDYLSFLAGNTGNSTAVSAVAASASYFGYTVASFKNEVALLQLKKAMDISVKTKMPVSQTGLPYWTTVETDATKSVDLLHPVADQIKNSVKGKYNYDWLTIATQLNNKIRENQKQTLISYMLTLGLNAPDGIGADGSGKVTDADGLFEYLLIDVQITSAVVTSRIIQATLGVQLFADRCILGLEAEVMPKPDPSDASNQLPPIDPGEWDWLKHYSIAAGLKKLFVYVENYLDPSLRDDKSPFFLDFESAIKKGDVTDENVENAFRDYIHKLNEVSNMECCGCCFDQPGGTLYVFARTHAAPYNYYYRTASSKDSTYNSWEWPPWQQVQLDIKSIDDGANSGVHLVPVLWKKRLFLFWPEFMERSPDPSANSNNSTTFTAISTTTPNTIAPQKYWEVRLAWSEFKGDKWDAKKLSKETLSLDQLGEPSFEDSELYNYIFQSAIDQGTEVLTLTLNQSEIRNIDFFSLYTISLGSFSLTDIHEQITTTVGYSPAIGDIDESSSQYEAEYQSFAADGALELGNTDFLQTETAHELLFSNALSLDQFVARIPAPFFYTDRSAKRTYFVTPLQNAFAVTPPPATIGTTLQIYPPSVPVTVILQRPEITPLYLLPPIYAYPAANISILGGLGKAAVPSVLESLKTNSPLAVEAKSVSSNNNTTAVPKNLFINNLPGSNLHGLNQVSVGLRVYNPDIIYEGIPFSGGPVAAPQIPKLAFYSFYHPFASVFLKKLNQGGVGALLAANTAEFAEDPAKGIMDTDTGLKANDLGTIFGYYNAVPTNVQQYDSGDSAFRNYYLQNVDFSEFGTYSCYNWELFFHAPLLIATMLSKNGKYDDARKWFHFIFNPFSTEKPDANSSNSPFWQVLPFKTARDVEMDQFIQGLQPKYDLDPHSPLNDDNRKIDDWRMDPFNAFSIARSRQIAFMKYTVMAYLDNLINQGDDLFQTYIRENINEATQYYILAAHILGPAQQFIPSRGPVGAASYGQLQLDDFGDAVIDIENTFPNSGDVQQISSTIPQNLIGIGQTLYFCVPPNDKLLGYWTTVGDRLFKIRHGQNINGVLVPLALFEPPIDPALLLKAKAQGLDIAGILADLDSPAPLFRFSYLLQKAKEFSGLVISLGSAVLSANEKQDAEQLARLRQTQEIAMLNLVTDIKSRQVLDAQASLQNLASSRATAIQKLQHYAVELLGNSQPLIPAPPSIPDTLDASSALPGETLINAVTSSIDITLSSADESGVKIIPKEKQDMDDSEKAYDWQLGASTIEGLAGILHLIPTFVVHGDPFGVGVEVDYGGAQIGAAASALSKVAQIVSSAYAHSASQASKIASFIRREQDWVFQANLTVREIVQLDNQIIAAEIKLQMAQHELSNHQQQIQNAQDIETFYELKFSRQELYDWMLDKLQGIHKQGYQLAYNMARKAEKAYQFELGIAQSNFIQYGYFNDTYLGITAGEQLQLALGQLETAFIENNVREFELTKHISVVLLNPVALIQLKETGSCNFDLSEELFDLDYPGHYFRRIKSISISIPCVAGPYTTVNSTLRLVNNKIRTDTAGDSQSSFAQNNIPCTAIATSTAQTDSGVFELNFRDERYLPFEGAGTISSWQLELNGKYLDSDDGTITDLSQFDYNSISDVIVHVKYTSRENAGDFRQLRIKNLKTFMAGNPFMRLFSIRHDFPNEWNLFLTAGKNAAVATQVLSIDISNRFPYLSTGKTITVSSVELFVDPVTPIASLDVVDPSSSTVSINLSDAGNEFGTFLHGGNDYNPGKNIGNWKFQTAQKVTMSDINDLIVVFHYSIK